MLPTCFLSPLSAVSSRSRVGKEQEDYAKERHVLLMELRDTYAKLDEAYDECDKAFEEEKRKTEAMKHVQKQLDSLAFSDVDSGVDSCDLFLTQTLSGIHSRLDTIEKIQAQLENHELVTDEEFGNRHYAALWKLMEKYGEAFDVDRLPPYLRCLLHDLDSPQSESQGDTFTAPINVDTVPVENKKENAFKRAHDFTA